MMLLFQNQFSCFCDNDFGRYGEVSDGDSWCSIPCPGDETYYCGGYDKNSIYLVNGKRNINDIQQIFIHITI